jgi:hypothetical protein
MNAEEIKLCFNLEKETSSEGLGLCQYKIQKKLNQLEKDFSISFDNFKLNFKFEL